MVAHLAALVESTAGTAVPATQGWIQALKPYCSLSLPLPCFLFSLPTEIYPAPPLPGQDTLCGRQFHFSAISGGDLLPSAKLVAHLFQ